MASDLSYDKKIEAIQSALEQGMAALIEAMKEIEQKDARIEELEEALRPFVQAAAVVEEDNFPDEYPVHATRGGDGEHLYQLTAGHFRTALKALKP